MALLAGSAIGVAGQEADEPTTTDQMLARMVTEEVRPGVFRVVNDGVRDLSYPVEGWGDHGFMVDVTPDGSVWLSGDAGGHGLFRLGEEPVFEDVEAFPRYREVAPDGSLWAIGVVSDDRRGTFSFDGEGWTVTPTSRRRAPRNRAVATAPRRCRRRSA